MAVFLEKVVPVERLYVFGAGHVGRALAAFAGAVGFEVHVVDEREQFLTAARFPDAARHDEEPADFARRAPLDEGDVFACVLTHDHALDQQVVEALLRRPLRYLGLIGSRRKAETVRARLEAKGFAVQEVGRLRCPMGLSIGALTPEEIALSVVGELVAVRRGAAGPTPEAPRPES